MNQQKTSRHLYSPDDLIINSKSGILYSYEEFKAIYDMCYALLKLDIAGQEAAHILVDFRLVVVDKK